MQRSFWIDGCKSFIAGVLLLLFQYIKMSSQILAHPLGQFSKAENRPVVIFPNDVWGDQFITYCPESKETRTRKKEQLEELKEEIRRKLMNANGNNSQQLKFIDALQRLGVAYHFEKEIEELLQHIYDNSAGDGGDEDLFSVALKFRLLRQHGYSISCGIFKEFMDEKGSLKKDLIRDVRGMLGLYEAAHLRFRGEDVLDEALAFTTNHLKSMVQHLKYPSAEEVAHALYQPIRRGVERVEARWYVTIYQNQTFHDKTLLQLAKLDFNLVQSQYKDELSGLNRWWREFDFATKLPFVRHRLLEAYFWAVAVCFEPEFSFARRILTKTIALICIIDDIYDAYGTFEELALFTEAIERWESHSIHHLPEYMQFLYGALMDLYQEIEEEMEKVGNQYRVPYGIEKMKNQVRSYFEEAKWLHEGRMPSMEEYMSIARVSFPYPLLITISIISMGEIVTKDELDWVMSDPKTVIASSAIGRLMNDMASHEFEQKRKHIPSSVECYMKQHGVSEGEARRELEKQVENAWKDINEEFLRPTAVPMALLMRGLNLCRSTVAFYKESDGYTKVESAMKKNIVSVFFDPII